ncbi:MAG: hypothetical protein KDC34_04270 [Saprospiraceae bacterium]|nr:hypothetical protein [Saprospiraceae bacterium]
MEFKFLDVFSRSLSLELPKYETMYEYLDFIIPLVRPWGEDIDEMEYYSQEGGKPWMEIREDESFHDVILHFFNEGGEYLRSVNGNMTKGKWRILEQSNKIIIEAGNVSELYELSYLDGVFFILRKHGDHHTNPKRKYFTLGDERVMTDLIWRDYVEALYNTYRNKAVLFRTLVYAAMIFVVAIILFAIFY